MASAIDPGAGSPTPSSAASSSQATTTELDREIWSIAWPAILSFVVVNLVDIVDVGLVGRLGRQNVAAWGYATQCVNLVETLVVSVGIGAVALMARAIGAGEPARARRALAGSMLVALSVSGLGLTLVTLVPRQLLGMLDARPEVIDIAVPYFRLTAGSMVLYGAAFMFECGLRAHKNTRAPMVVAVAVMSVKTVLSVVLIFGLLGFPRLELLGAGIATLAAHGVGLVLFAAVSRVAAPAGASVTFGWRDVQSMWDVAAEVLLVSLPAMGERLIMNLALLTYFKILSSFGTAAIAAYAIGVRLLAISWVPGLGFAAAASTLVGQALGARDSMLARRIGFRAVRQAMILMCALSFVFFFLRTPLAQQCTDDLQVASDLAPFMLMLALAQPFMGAHFTLGGVLRGAGDTVTPLIGAAVGNWGFRVPLAWIFARVFGAHLIWVWAALIADHLARLAINGFAFVRGRWAKKIGATIR
ncbi:MAG: MATE family efflux transporter [Polyangiaceae bacterium]